MSCPAILDDYSNRLPYKSDTKGSEFPACKVDLLSAQDSFLSYMNTDDATSFWNAVSNDRVGENFPHPYRQKFVLLDHNVTQTEGRDYLHCLDQLIFPALSSLGKQCEQSVLLTFISC